MKTPKRPALRPVVSALCMALFCGSAAANNWTEYNGDKAGSR